MAKHRSAVDRLREHRDMLEAIFDDWRELGLLEDHAAALHEWSRDYWTYGLDDLSAADRAFHIERIRTLFTRSFPSSFIDALRVETSCLCRGDGKFYVECAIHAPYPFYGLECTADVEGRACPAGIYPLDTGAQGPDQRWVLELPWVAACALNVTVRVKEQATTGADMSFGLRKAKWLSRLNYRLHPQQCAAIRDYERGFSYRRFQVRVEQRFEDGARAIYRCSVRWRGERGAEPYLRVIDASGALLDARCCTLETQHVVGQDGCVTSLVSSSVIVPLHVGEFIVEAHDGAGCVASGFAAIEPAAIDALRAAAADLMRTADDGESYRAWLSSRRATPDELGAQGDRQPEAGLISVVVADVGRDFDGLSRTLGSLRAQTYASWEAVVFDEAGCERPFVEDARIRWVSGEGAIAIEAAVDAACGEYAAFVHAGDWLEPDALFWFASAIERAGAEGRSLGVLYCDEDESSEDGSVVRPLFKSRFNLDAQYSGDWVGNLCMLRRDALTALPAVAHPLALWKYDRVLRAYEEGALLHHVSRLLYHGMRRPIDAGALGVVLQGHFDRRRLPAEVGRAGDGRHLRVRYDLSEPHPLISIIIPTKDHIELLDACISSIIDKATYDAYEILVVENNSVQDETFAYYEKVERVRANVRVLKWPGEFNFPKIVNFAAQQAAGDVLLLLNNDTEVIEPAFMEEMAGMLMRPEVGVVGAKLLFRDGLVQHAGVAVGVWDAVAHVNQNRAIHDGGYLDRACVPGEFSAVTGACQMIRKEVFAELGGYDESFAVGFNDIDFCLRAQEAGYLVAYTPYALLYHYEFATRGREVGDDEKMRRWKREQARFIERWPSFFLENDPYTGPNLMRNNTYYRLS